MTEFPRAVRFAALLDNADGAHDPADFVAFCDGTGDDPGRVELRVAHSPVAATERAVDAVIESLESWCIGHGLILMENPSAQVLAALDPRAPAPERHLAPDVGEAVTAAFNAGDTDPSHLSDRFALGGSRFAEQALQGTGGGPSDRGPSPTQQRKCNKFLDGPLQEEATELIRTISRINELTDEALGADWGITVWPTDTRVMRVNVGTRLTAELTSGGEFHLYCDGPRTDLLGLPETVSFDGGFKSLPDSYSVVAPLGEAPQANWSWVPLADRSLERSPFVGVDD